MSDVRRSFQCKLNLTIDSSDDRRLSRMSTPRALMLLLCVPCTTITWAKPPFNGLLDTTTIVFPQSLWFICMTARVWLMNGWVSQLPRPLQQRTKLTNACASINPVGVEQVSSLKDIAIRLCLFCIGMHVPLSVSFESAGYISRRTFVNECIVSEQM